MTNPDAQEKGGEVLWILFEYEITISRRYEKSEDIQRIRARRIGSRALETVKSGRVHDFRRASTHSQTPPVL